MGQLFVILGGVFVAVCIVVVALYLIAAAGLCGMAEKAGIEEGWLAFIPLLLGFIWGKIIKEIKIGKVVIPKAEFVLLLSLLAVPLIIYGTIGWVLCIGTVLLHLVALYQLYALYKQPKAVLCYMLLSIIFPPVIPFLFLSLRNKELINPEEPYPFSEIDDLY